MPTKNELGLVTSINGLTNQGVGLNELIQTLQMREFLNNPDVIVDINQLSADNELNIFVPDLGKFSLTDWSKSQLSSLLGIRFNKWFENSSPEDKAYELNRRFSRASKEVKLRTTILGAESNGNEGTLNAIVSPSFGSVKDSEVAEMLYDSLIHTEPDLRVLRADITTRSTSFVLGVGDAFIPGGNQEIGTIFGGIHIQNSGVGYSSLSMILHLTRLVCKNGMTVPIHGAEILRMRHTSKLSIEKIREEGSCKVAEAPEKFRQASKVLELSQEHQIEDAEIIIKDILQENHLPKKLLEPLVESFNSDVQKNSFGIAQAITDSKTLTELQVKPEERLRLEKAAGNYLHRLTSIN
jgi:septum formation inhibitor MinC